MDDIDSYSTSAASDSSVTYMVCNRDNQIFSFDRRPKAYSADLFRQLVHYNTWNMIGLDMLKGPLSPLLSGIDLDLDKYVPES